MKCSFCGSDILEGTGMIFVFKTGKRHNFCSRKCEKNLLKLGRKPSKQKWTAAFRSEKKPDKAKKEAKKGK
ncbi:MAG: 50S ribosomal protein L24e [Candidatus Diapherotrites archaeon]|jgi:large subunit ribosomal protein L24e|nr:50S ribosomal protein L24e [Candidatus Diapherotrites archaeon]